MRVAVVGAGVAGLCCAVELRARGAEVELFDRGAAVGDGACSWFAGGMLAPWCERENADEAVLVHGRRALQWWAEQVPGVTSAGSLVVAPPRDQPELRRFTERSCGHAWLRGEAIAALEPDLEGRFEQGLYFADEAHLDPRAAIAALADKLARGGARFHWGEEVQPEQLDFDAVLDCRGYAARDDWRELRGVKGEMLILRTEEVSLNRPVRLLHPRIPLYIVPRADHYFMLGATMVENAQRRRFTARSMLELLGSAYALHPAFAEAEIVETGVDVRPAFVDNLPRLQRQGRVLRANGLYRHGFLLGPALARAAAEAVFHPQRQLESFA